MKTADQHCTEFVIDYCKNRWDSIDIDKVDYERMQDKDQFIKELKENFDTVTWFITEVLNWGLKTEFSFKVNDEPLVYKLFGKYIKFELDGDNWVVSYTQKVPKTIYVFE